MEKVIYLDTGLQPSCRLCEKMPLRSKRIEHGESVASIVGIWNQVAGVGAVKVVVVVLLVIERVEESSNCKTSPGGQGEQEHGAGWQHLGCPQDQRINKFMQLTIKDAFPCSRVPGAQKTKRMVEIVTWKVEFQMILLRAEMR